MNDDIEKTSTIELIKDLTYTEKKLELYMYKYELIRKELIRRIPTLENDENFEPRFMTQKPKEGKTNVK